MIKAAALTCNEYEVVYQQTHNMNNACIGNKCVIYCRCCCLSSCRYGCCSDNVTPKEIYTLAKYEIELMVAAANDGDGDTITSKVSSNQSQIEQMHSVIKRQQSDKDQ